MLTNRAASAYFVELVVVATFLLLSGFDERGGVVVWAQGCSNRCPPLNYGTLVPSICEGDYLINETATEQEQQQQLVDIDREYTVCHPTNTANTPSSFRFRDFLGERRITVISNFYIGCNAGRRESGVFAHVAQKYYDKFSDHRITFVSSLKGGTTCNQWASIYQADAQRLFPDTGVVPVEMPLAVSDEDYQIRDDFFTTPFGHPSYVILDANLQVRHKFIGPCCGYESYADCTPDIARGLDVTLSSYLDALLAEEGGDGQPSSSSPPTANPSTTNPPTTTTDESSSNCELGDFSEWSVCSVTCGEGIQFRWRTLLATPPSSTGNACDGIAPVETRTCIANTETCPPSTCMPPQQQNIMDQQESSLWDIEMVASGFDGPRDLAFHPSPGYHLGNYSEGRRFFPDQGEEEIWVANGNNHSISIVTSVGTPYQSTLSRRDRGYYHYLINITALAFNGVADSGRTVDRDSFNYFAACNDNRNTYLDTKEPNNFMGPTLYSTNPQDRNLVNRLGEICQDDEPCFFSHADMLHEAPACIGMTHDPEVKTAYGNVYWAFDSTGNQVNGQLVRFDFQQPHGPGSMDHSVAAVRRFPQVVLERSKKNNNPAVHAGMVLHPTTRELFIAVPGGEKVIVVHADSGAYARTAREEYPIFSSRLPSFEYSIWECPEQRTFASGIDEPSGLALSLDGEVLFVVERGTGRILAYEVASQSLLFHIDTGLKAIAGMEISPIYPNKLYFVEEETNALYVVVDYMQHCNRSGWVSRVNPDFTEAVADAKEQVGSSFSLYRDYSCVVDPIVPDAVFFDQVHEDTGYASDNPNVQGMAGMDETAILLANRTDCGRTSDLNFDALLLGGFYCHPCLPEGNGAECDAGGLCTNVQWNGYVCDNEFIVTVTTDNDNVVGLSLQRANGTALTTDDSMRLQVGVTYRFTVRGSDDNVCLSLMSSSEEEEQDGGISVLEGRTTSTLSSFSNTIGCTSRGPLIVTIQSDFPNEVYLHTDQDELVAVMSLQVEKQDVPEDSSSSSSSSSSVLASWLVSCLLTLFTYYYG